MVVLNQGSTNDNIYVTLTEKVTLTTPFYLFQFTNVTTKQVVTFTKATTDDLSFAITRFNQFLIDTSVVFADTATGQWQYVVYEAPAIDTVSTTGLEILEQGKMFLVAAETISLVGYNSISTYTGYAG